MIPAGNRIKDATVCGYAYYSEYGVPVNVQEEYASHICDNKYVPIIAVARLESNIQAHAQKITHSADQIAKNAASVLETWETPASEEISSNRATTENTVNRTF